MTIDAETSQLDGDPGEHANGEEETPAPAAGEEETFPRSFVEQLRRESAEHRTLAKRADDMEARLLSAVARRGDPRYPRGSRGRVAGSRGERVAQRGRASRPREGSRRRRGAGCLEPHLAKRRLLGDIDQGARPESSQAPNLAGMLRERAI